MIHAGDCREVNWAPAGVFPDVMITDPPYRSHVHASTTSCAAHGKRKGVRQNALGFGALSAELMQWTCELASRVSRWSCIYTDIESVGAWAAGLEAAGASYIRAIPWVRWSMPQLSGDRPPQGAEMIILAWGAAAGRKSWNGPGNLTHLAHRCLRGEGKHRAEKPLDLALDLVSWFSNPGEIIADPFAGAGTFSVAAKMLGRKTIGAELQPEWAEKANARIDRLPVLSARDQARYDTWQAAQLAATADAARRAAVTAKARARYSPSSERQLKLYADADLEVARDPADVDP